jgi:uncharacterized damage-inducible protein DinB
MQEKIELLKWMLEDIRRETISGVSTLTKEQLFAAPENGEFPVGAYLMHLCECDLHWLEVISGKEQPDELKKKCYFDKWFDSFGESSPPSTAPELIEYASLLKETRSRFLEYISSLNDSDLDATVVIKRKSGDVSLSKKWIIYHIIEHEAHHRGQMFLLIRKAGWKSDQQLKESKTEWWLNPGKKV